MLPRGCHGLGTRTDDRPGIRRASLGIASPRDMMTRGCGGSFRPSSFTSTNALWITAEMNNSRLAIHTLRNRL